ncbi:histidine phosphatase family protein, partial [Xanthomonas perforans]
MRILLARHGETPWNAEGRYQGQIDIPLSPVGEGQARALGERLHTLQIDRAVASPLSRAQATAKAALGASRQALLQTDADLQE